MRLYCSLRHVYILTVFVPNMTYNVFGGTLDLVIYLSVSFLLLLLFSREVVYNR